MLMPAIRAIPPNLRRPGRLKARKDTDSNVKNQPSYARLRREKRVKTYMKRTLMNRLADSRVRIGGRDRAGASLGVAYAAGPSK